MSWDYAKDHLTLCLRRKTTENILKQDFLDLEMCVRVLLPEDKRNPFRYDSVSSYVVKPGFFPDVKEEEIFNRAFQNLKKDAVVNDMVKTLMMRTGFSMEQIQTMGLLIPIPMIVVSNKTGHYGASTICDMEILDGLARDEKSRTFSSNSKRSHILRTSSRSRRLILSSIVSFAVWLKWTRTI